MSAMLRKSLASLPVHHRLGVRRIPRRGFGTTTSRTEISPHDLEKLNKTSSRLYRIFLKSIPNSLTAKGPAETSYIASNDNANDDNNENYMLLQPPLNHLDYGQARLMDASVTSSWNDKKLSDDDRRSRIQEIISFFLYQTQCQNAADDTFDHEQLEAMLSQMQGHGNGNDVNDIDGDDNINGNEIRKSLEGFEDDLDKSVFASGDVLKKSLREGFRLISTEQDTVVTKADIVKYHRWAIAAIQIWEEQLDMWGRTSIHVDADRGLRVTATSSCIGKTAVGHLSTNENTKNRFCYRIRIENFNPPNTGIDDDENVFQLLGRMWKITECHSNEENVKNDDEDFDAIVTVNAPTTGVVGHLPVIRPGEVFEYMSSCDLKTQTGTMGGHFHMAVVDEDTESAQVGDMVEALHAPSDKLFEIPVAPFRLDASHMVTK